MYLWYLRRWYLRTMKDLNIILLNYFTKDDILRAVESVFRDAEEIPYDIAVTVADNSGNKDGLRDALAKNFPQALYVDTGGNVGFGQGNNRGMAACSARYFFVLNRDVVIPPGKKTLERCIRFMDDHPRVGAMGPKLLNMDGTLQYSCYRFDTPSLAVKPLRQLRLDRRYRWAGERLDRLLMKDFDHAGTQPVDWVLGAAMMVRHEAAQEAGMFDPRYFMYMEDCDSCRAMWEAGWPVYYVHTIEIFHAHARESARVPGLRSLLKNRLARIHLASWLKYIWKWRKTQKYFGEL